MRIPRKQGTNAEPRARPRWRRPGWGVWPAVGLLAYGAFAFAGGVAFLDFLRPALQNLSGATTTRRAVSAAARAPGNYLRSWLGGAAVETLAIDLGF